MTLGNDFKNSSYRTLENPPARLGLPPHLAQTVPFQHKGPLARALRDGAAACGLDFDKIKRINIAWPQKHPHSNHINRATKEAENLRLALYDSFRRLDVTMAHALYETIKLDRSENPSSLHSLSKRQIFAVDPQLQQDEPLPFLTPEGAKGEVFILTDWVVSQGTTLANLASFIMHNGGHVIAIATESTAYILRQDGLANDPFFKAASNRETPTSLAHIFAAAAKGESDYSPAECTILFQEALKPNGLSLSTLTFGEYAALKSTMRNGATSFGAFITALGLPPQRQKEIIANARTSFGASPA